MPTGLIHRIGIAAPAETIYHALTTEDGIRAWWTTDVTIGECVGDTAVFGFFNRETVFEMRIEELILNGQSDANSPSTVLRTPSPPAGQKEGMRERSLVRWKCIGGTSPDWVGTTQEFVLEPQDDEVLLRFCHGGWERGGDHCYYCSNTTRGGHLLVCLKDYAEREVKNPYFR